MWLRSKSTYTEKEINLLLASLNVVMSNDFIMLAHGAELRILKEKLLKEKENN